MVKKQIRPRKAEADEGNLAVNLDDIQLQNLQANQVRIVFKNSDQPGQKQQIQMQRVPPQNPKSKVNRQI